MSLRPMILGQIGDIAREQHKTLPDLTDAVVLMDTDFDSLCFALLVARLEDLTGLDPFAAMETADLPVTVGDLVALYDRASAGLPAA